MKKETKKKLLKLLATKTDKLKIKDWKFLDTHLTYEIVNEYIDKTGRPVVLRNITSESDETRTLPITQLLKL